MQETYMRRAIELAKKGIGAVNPNPLVGAVIVKDGRIIGEGYHRRYGELHAERDAFAHLTEDAAGAEMYVTLEPCPMCAGAIMNSRLKRVVYGAFDDKNGACASVVNLFEERFTHIPFVRSRILMQECGDILTKFFRELRESPDK